jgi:HPr kinase/phosphorylase
MRNTPARDSQSSIEFLGVSIPVIDMPVAPGRNVSTLVEVAARMQLLRQRGYRPLKQRRFKLRDTFAVRLCSQ